MTILWKGLQIIGKLTGLNEKKKELINQEESVLYNKHASTQLNLLQ